jgi:NAD(P)-dependent dehydrogenase (short-subunit alcohol dehydrogenase family)
MKTAVVTGASKGLGSLVATNLEGLGYRVIRASRTSGDRVNVTNPDKVHEFMSRVVAENGRIDVLINNAGFVRAPHPAETTTTEELRETFTTNVFGPFYMMKEAISVMKKQGEGIIVNVASKAGVYSVPGLGAYSASKAALLSLSQAVAKELKDTNVKCVVVCPGGMNTQMRARVYGTEDAARQQSPHRVADYITEIVDRGTLDGASVAQGSCVIIRKTRLEVLAMQNG